MTRYKEEEESRPAEWSSTKQPFFLSYYVCRLLVLPTDAPLYVQMLNRDMCTSYDEQVAALLQKHIASKGKPKLLKILSASDFLRAPE